MSTKTNVEKKTKRETSKDDNLNSKKPDEKVKKSIYSVSTPRNFMQKSSAVDIYARKNQVHSAVAPKKTAASTSKVSNVSPMKDMLKSSPSNVSQSSTRSYRLKSVNDSKITPRNTGTSNGLLSSRDRGVVKKIPFSNITVNSPIAKRRLNVDANEQDVKVTSKIDLSNRNNVKNKQKKTAEVVKPIDANKGKEIISHKIVLPERKRTKTRTLEEDEIIILTPDIVDNNLEMLNLNKKLSAQPKAFYVDMNEQTPKLPRKPVQQAKESDEEVNYEDDFESYESDFDSYQSDLQSDHTSTIGDDNDYRIEDDDDNDDCRSNDDNFGSNARENAELLSKEESMLDSGNFELRDPHSVGKSKPMDYIVEDTGETDKKVSLTDEGFQEMSSSSGLSSMKTLHIDILDRPLFIDFTKSKENRRKRKIFESLKQRADDILSMVTLHEMSYDLYEMNPIPYDLYMATFGRFNYTQTAVQTFDDGVIEEIQTDEILTTDKWTQNPIKFSSNYCFVNQNGNNMKKKDSIENFSFLFDNDQDDTDNIMEESYKNNPLRIYLEQKDGVGTNKILPYKNYRTKLKNDEYDPKRLRKFLKKAESRISNILSKNSGNTISNLNKTSKFPFSNEYLLIPARGMTDDNSFLNKSQIIAVIYSDTKTNLIILVHSKVSSGINKCVLSMWDLSVAILKPLKILIATDDVKIGRFRGSASGFIVGGLCDGTILLWDLSEEATCCIDTAREENSTKMVENTPKMHSVNVSHNNKDSDVESLKQHTLQACAYTTSGLNVCNDEMADSIVGLEFVGGNTTMDCDRKILAQLCALQRIGILTIWSIIQEKTKHLKHDTGKALWSKMKLERNLTINLAQHIDLPLKDVEMASVNFNLNSAKKRMSTKRSERNKNKIPRLKSAIVKCQDDSLNVASKKDLAINNSSWENGIVCNDLKVMSLNGIENYLIGKNGGEVLCCRRDVGSVKVKSFCVASSASSINCIEASPHGLPYFLAATDCGTVNMCSLHDFRVLLTLDCRNGPSSVVDKCKSDHKGRYLSSVTVKSDNTNNVVQSKLPITSISWLHPNPFCITATFATSTLIWELTHSDIRAKCRSEGVSCKTNERSLALLTTEGDVQVYKLSDSRENYLELFQKYVALL